MDLRMDIERRSWIWTFGYDKLSALSLFLLFDVILSLNQNDDVISKLIDHALANKLWTFLSKYTYGLYLSHAMPMFMLMSPSICDVENGGIGPDNYGFVYIATLFGKAF